MSDVGMPIYSIFLHGGADLARLPASLRIGAGLGNITVHMAAHEAIGLAALIDQRRSEGLADARALLAAQDQKMARLADARARHRACDAQVARQGWWLVGLAAAVVVHDLGLWVLGAV